MQLLNKKIIPSTVPASASDGEYVFVGVLESKQSQWSTDHGSTFGNSNIQTGFRYASSWMNEDGQYILSGPQTPSDFMQLSSNTGSTFADTDTSKSGLWSPVTNCAMSADGTYMYTSEYNDHIRKSSNSGSSWVDLSAASTAQWRGICCTDDGRYVTAVFSTGNIKVSYNYGVTFSLKQASAYRVGVAMSGDGKYQITGINNGVLEGSSDYGVNWSTYYTPVTGSSRDCAVSGTGQYMVVASTSGIWLSDDYGNSWTVEGSASFSSAAISWHGEYQYAVVNNGGVYQSDDFGVTWTLILPSSTGAYSVATNRLKV